MSKKYQVWECRIYVPASASIPAGFDNPPRSAAQRAIESAGIEIIANFSGWAGTPQEREVAFIENRLPVPQAERIEHLERVLVQAREALSFYADESRYHGPNQALIEHDEWSAKVGLCAYRLDVARDHGVIASTASAAIDEALKEKTNG
jgi:hypothetical protein